MYEQSKSDSLHIISVKSVWIQDILIKVVELCILNLFFYGNALSETRHDRHMNMTEVITLEVLYSVIKW